MAAVRDFFLVEAGDCLEGLRSVLQAAGASDVEAHELLRLSRGLRGSAQMAREERVRCVAEALEAAARALVSRVLPWSEDVRGRALATLDDLRALVRGDGPEAEADARVARALERWRVPGIRLPSLPSPRSGHSPGADAGHGGGAAASPEFLTYAARELAGILAELDAQLPALAREPRGREPLKAILRRQRALLGAAPLDGLPAVAEALRSIDELARLVARQDAAVDGDRLEAFRLAREVLAEAAAALRQGIARAECRSLPRLRLLRDGLVGRPGAAEKRRAPTPPPAADETPVEVFHFFRTEARLLLDRMERMASELARATPERQASLRRELHSALSALRDTAETFGFAPVARTVETALARIGGSTAELLALIPELREAVSAPEPPRPDAAQVGEGGREGEGRSVPPRSPAPSPSPADEIIPVEQLLYRGQAALRRALELRPLLERAVAADPAAREAVEELFDLMRQELS